MDKLKELGKLINSLLERVPAKQIDLGLAIAITLLGVVVYAFTEIGNNSMPVFSFLHNIELRSLDARGVSGSTAYASCASWGAIPGAPALGTFPGASRRMP